MIHIGIGDAQNASQAYGTKLQFLGEEYQIYEYDYGELLVISQNFLTMDMLGKMVVWLGGSLLTEILCSITDLFLHLIFWYVIFRLFEKRLCQMEKLFNNGSGFCWVPSVWPLW